MKTYRTIILPVFCVVVILGGSNITWVIKLRRLRWAGHVARIGEGTGAYRFWWKNLKEGDHLRDPDIDGRIILRRIFERLDEEDYGLA
jgi:hypothetical protein